MNDVEEQETETRHLVWILDRDSHAISGKVCLFVSTCRSFPPDADVASKQAKQT